MIEPLLTTVAKKLHNINPDREVSPVETEQLLISSMTSPVDWDAVVGHLRELPNECDHALCEWVRARPE